MRIANNSYVVDYNRTAEGEILWHTVIRIKQMNQDQEAKKEQMALTVRLIEIWALSKSTIAVKMVAAVETVAVAERNLSNLLMLK